MITRRQIPSDDPRLRRHVHHDDRSRDYAFPTAGLDIVSAVHTRHIPILDQGQVGSCTGNAGIGALGTDPVNAGIVWPDGSTPFDLDETGALTLYSAAEVIDGDGPYPPNDNGSSGLSIAQVIKSYGIIAGYTHTFSRDDALRALALTPIMLGVGWHQNMYDPDPDGRLNIGGPVVGGHEILCREIDAVNGRVWIDNSWGTSWGVNGRAYLTWDDLGALLDDQGDVTILTPLVPVAPPAPVDLNAAFYAVMDPWAALRHIGVNRDAADAYKAWRTAA